MVDACTTVVGHCHDRSHHLTLMGKVMINRRVGDVNVLGKTQNDVRAYRSAITCPLSIYQSVYLSIYLHRYIYIRVWVCVDIAHITYLCVCAFWSHYNPTTYGKPVESFTWSPHLLPGIAILCRPHDVVTPLPKAAQVDLTDLLKVREAAEPWFFPLVFSPQVVG